MRLGRLRGISHLNQILENRLEVLEFSVVEGIYADGALSTYFNMYSLYEIYFEKDLRWNYKG